MSLTNRVSLFFLAMLALVLVGFSVGLYLLARGYLYHQVDERLEAALNALAAAIEVEPEGLAWELNQRQLTLGHDTGREQVRWSIRGLRRGREVLRDRSLNLKTDAFPVEAAAEPVPNQTVVHDVTWQNEPWRLARRHFPAPRTAQTGPGGPGQAGDGEAHYDALVFTAGVSLAPLQATLRKLAITLCGLSGGLLLLAAVAGRWMCRRALVPVTTMARAARAMNAAALDQRLPRPQTGDELEDLGWAFNGLLERVQESFERQRRFTGDASHQLRTPLAAMLGQVEVALRRPRSPEEYQRVLAVVRSKAARLRQIVEMLMFLSRADAEARLPDLQTVELAGWLENHLLAWSDHARASDLLVETAGRAPLWVKAHPALLGQLVDNLLDNACKYSAPGSPITLHLHDNQSTVSLQVEDAGCGIPAEDVPHVFEPFFRSAQTRRLDLAGVGLGLSVAHRIALAFGGTLAVKSEPGKGAQFALRLPKAPAGEPVGGTEEAQRGMAPGALPRAWAVRSDTAAGGG